MRSSSVSTFYAMAARPQGIEPATVTGLAIAVIALAAAFRSVKELFDDDAKDALRWEINGGDVLDQISRTDPRLQEFLGAVAQFNKECNVESSPTAILRAAAEIDAMSNSAPACEVVMAELRSLQFRARQRCAKLYAEQRNALERGLAAYIKTSNAHVLRLEGNLSDDPGTRMSQQQRIKKLKSDTERYKQQCAALTRELLDGTASEKQLAFARANTLRSALEHAKERERAAYESLASTKTTLRPVSSGSTSVSFSGTQSTGVER